MAVRPFSAGRLVGSAYWRLNMGLHDLIYSVDYQLIGKSIIYGLRKFEGCGLRNDILRAQNVILRAQNGILRAQNDILRAQLFDSKFSGG